MAATEHLKISQSINRQQVQLLTDFMAEHTDLARGHLKALNAKNVSDNLWKALSTSLNESGPPVRTAAEWKKVWADYKYKVKNKLRFNRSIKRQFGSRPHKQKPFDVFEKSVIESAGLEAAVDKVRPVKTFDFGPENIQYEPPVVSEYIKTNEPSYEVLCEDDTEIASTNSNPVPLNASKSPTKGTKLYFLKKILSKVEDANKIRKSLLEEKKEQNSLRRKFLQLNRKRYSAQVESTKLKSAHRAESLRLTKMLIEAKIEKNRLKQLELEKM